MTKTSVLPPPTNQILSLLDQALNTEPVIPSKVPCCCRAVQQPAEKFAIYLLCLCMNLRIQNKKKQEKVEEDSEEGKPNNRGTAEVREGTRTRALRDEISESELYADSDASEDEGIPDYKVGGYHPVHIGERLVDRYIIV